MTVIKVQTKGKEQIVSVTSLFHLTKENEPQAVVCFVLMTQQRSHLFIFSGTECCSVPTIVQPKWNHLTDMSI